MYAFKWGEEKWKEGERWCSESTAGEGLRGGERGRDQRE